MFCLSHEEITNDSDLKQFPVPQVPHQSFLDPKSRPSFKVNVKMVTSTEMQIVY